MMEFSPVCTIRHFFLIPLRWWIRQILLYLETTLGLWFHTWGLRLQNDVDKVGQVSFEIVVQPFVVQHQHHVRFERLCRVQKTLVSLTFHPAAGVDHATAILDLPEISGMLVTGFQPCLLHPLFSPNSNTTNTRSMLHETPYTRRFQKVWLIICNDYRQAQMTPCAAKSFDCCTALSKETNIKRQIQFFFSRRCLLKRRKFGHRSLEKVAKFTACHAVEPNNSVNFLAKKNKHETLPQQAPWYSSSHIAPPHVSKKT